MRTIFILLTSFFISAGLSAQQKAANISFSENVWDYGNIKEEDGVANHRFEFTNTGSEPLIIHNVSASCGCTAPSWTREPVMPGSKGYVGAAYDPRGRPGKFDKFVTVVSNASNSTVNLRITGNVIAKPLTIEDEYRFAMGSLRLKTNHVSFGTVNKGNQLTKMEEIINNSDKAIDIEIRNIPSHLQVKLSHSRLDAGQKGNIEVLYDGSKQNEWGFMIDRMNVYVNGETDRRYQLIVSANIEEDFSGWTEQQLTNAPVIAFEETTFNIGNMKKGEKLDYEYVFTNKGKSDLIIRKVTAACGCTATMLSENVISPGKTGRIKTTFNSAGRVGNQSKTITVITNDPKNPRIVLWIRGEVID